MKKIGFVCKWIDHIWQIGIVKPGDDAKKYNTSTTTVAWLNRQTRSVAEDKLWQLMEYNITSVHLLVERVSKLEPPLRMVRISSEVLPCYTEPTWNYFWKRPDVRSYMEKHFAPIGQIARAAGVRLSFHPGQFTVLASHRDDIVDLSIEEVEYHADMARWMGYGVAFQDLKINTHIAGKRGPSGIRSIFGRLSPEARNCLTIENEEITWGLDNCLELADLCPIVLDIHHHYCREGEYIEHTDPRIQKIIDSWRGVRPVIHYSQSREKYLADYPSSVRPDRDTLIAAGINKQKLRAHSDFMHHPAINKWAKQHWQWSDVMVECKSKNLGSQQLFEFWQNMKDSV